MPPQKVQPWSKKWSKQNSMTVFCFIFLNHISPFMKSGKWARKIPETLLGTSSTKTLHMLARLFAKGLSFMHGTDITTTDNCDQQDSWRSASRFLSKIVYKWEHKKIFWNPFACLSELLNSFTFTDLVDVNSVNQNVPYVSSVKM